MPHLRHLGVGRLDLPGADDADREDRAADLQRQPGRAGVTPVQDAVTAPGALREDAEQLAAAQHGLGGVERGSATGRRPTRSMGIMPSAGKTCFVFHESMYSALPTKLIRRGTVSIRNAESRKLTWFGQRIAGPAEGRRSYPSRWKRHSRRATGAGDAPPAVLERGRALVVPVRLPMSRPDPTRPALPVGRGRSVRDAVRTLTRPEVDAEERRGGVHALAAGDGIVDGGERSRRVQVVVERVADLGQPLHVGRGVGGGVRGRPRPRPATDRAAPPRAASSRRPTPSSCR